MQDAPNWITEETKSVNFGDKRLNKRYGNVLNNLASSPNKSIPASCKSWGETLAAYRFLNNEEVTAEQILFPHKEATIERIKKEKIVLIPQDTTDMDFSGRETISGMGYLNSEKTQGFYLHPSIAVTPDRVCLGIVDIQMWVREELGSRKQKNKPIEEKESYCWLKGYEAANKIALVAPETTIVSVSDREGDIYELLGKMPSEINKAYWLIRSQHNRILLNRAGEKQELRLWQELRTSKSIGEIEFKLPKGRIYERKDKRNRPPRTERIVRQEIRIGTVQIKPPFYKEKNQESITMYVVHCREIDPPYENERLEWFLITSYPVINAETAINVVNWYLCRWQIEIFFKILKSGCNIEELQFDTYKATANCISLYLIIAWRILYLTMLGRNCPDLDCNVVFEEDEWHAVYAIVTKKSPPKKPPKLNEIIIMIAKLGGFLGRKSDGSPGNKVMWIGLQRMKDFTLAWETFRLMGDQRCV
jgi:hypothetical protein